MTQYPINNFVGWQITNGTLTDPNDTATFTAPANVVQEGDVLVLFANLSCDQGDQDPPDISLEGSAWAAGDKDHNRQSPGAPQNLLVATYKTATSDDTGTSPTSYTFKMLTQASQARKLQIAVLVYRGVTVWKSYGVLTEDNGGTGAHGLSLPNFTVPEGRSLVLAFHVNASGIGATGPDEEDEEYGRLIDSVTEAPLPGWVFTGLYNQNRDSQNVFSTAQRSFDGPQLLTNMAVPKKVPAAHGMAGHVFVMKVNSGTPAYDEFPWVVEWHRVEEGSLGPLSDSYSVSPPALCEAGDLMIFQVASSKADSIDFTMDARWTTLAAFNGGKGRGLAAIGS